VLVLAILLLLVAVGLLVAVLVTGQIALAWASVGVSALVGLLLVVRRRRVLRHGDREDAEPGEPGRSEPVAEPVAGEATETVAGEAADSDQPEPEPAQPDLAEPSVAGEDSAESDGSAVAGAEPGTAEQGTAGSGEVDSAEPERVSQGAAGAANGVPAAADRPADAEPDEEDTDAADHLLVWEMQDEVLVVDEHPRYHLAGCTWPEPGSAEPLPVQEARELGFTPCAVCRPDRTLARRHRATKVAAEG
jgi:hypothetical protein